jgi:DNA-3-methyladenine glycosylase II
MQRDATVSIRGDGVKKPTARTSKTKAKSVETATAAPQTRVDAVMHLCVDTDDDVRAGIDALRLKCAFIRAAHDLAGHPPLRRRESGFEGLVRIVNGQQLSVASATAIHARVVSALHPLTAANLLAASDETLRACGLSRPKIKTLRAVSAAVVEGLDLAALGELSEAEAMARLTSISGIGPWTAEIYLMFCVGHADIFASGDLALQVAAQLLMGLPSRPTSREMAEIAERWHPHRAIAARMLWAYYAVAKKQGIAVPV